MENALCIALIQPSSPPDQKLYEKAIDILRKNFIPFKSFVDFIETPPFQKAFLLYEIFTSQKFTHLWAVRGGAGAIKLLPYLDELFKDKNFLLFTLPPIIGFSDVTALHLYFWKKFKIKGLHAPMLIHLPKLHKDAFKRLKEILLEDKREGKLIGKGYRKGIAEGIIFGGNLTVLASLCGTPYFPTEDKIILMLEDTNEKLYRLERSFLQILFTLPKNSLSGIILGDLGEVSSLEFLRKIEEFLPPNIPIGYDFSFGHINKNYPFPVGAKAYFKVTEKRGEISFKF
ncbi:MAG: LD-carboxypeptidase [Caldimicrobium sp.]